MRCPYFCSMFKIYISALASFLVLSQISAQIPIVTAAVPTATTVEMWGKFEVKLTIAANFSNPYNYDEIRTAATITAPDGKTRQVEGFFIQDYSLNTQTGTLAAVGTGSFKIRFSPDQIGVWKYKISCTNAAGTGDFPEQTFTATLPNSLKNKGFVRGDQTNYLHFDDGEQYIPVGENIGWQNGNAYLDFKKWVTKLADNGGNFFRMWHCSWGLGLEWKNGSDGYAGLRKYKQTNAFYQDWLFDFCAERGVNVMLCLHHHGQVSSQVNPNWSESPYNLANGGTCQNTWDFFTNSEAKNHVKNRLRYVVARWGYSRAIAFWELFNEVDWTDQFAQKKGDVSNWHGEMAAFLKNNDPYQHLVTTSYAQDFYDPQAWNHPDIDFTQTHYYVNTPNMERVLVAGVQNYLDDFGKPTMNGEFGLTTTGGNLSTADPTGIHFHNALWASLFGGGAGAGASWWWDNYIEPQNLYPNFAPVAAVAQAVPFKNANLAPAPATVSGAPGDLQLTPTVSGWGGLADTVFNIAAGGAVTPSGAALGSFLYGSQWNTQFRRPPIFKVNFLQNGQFRVKTASETGQAPKIAIWLDGAKVLEQAAAVNQTYSINVPAGQHTIKVDNTGTDWILISGYVFTNLGSAVDAYVLKSSDKKHLAGWVLNNRYNHDYLKNTGLPPAASGAVLTVPDVENGAFSFRFYSCLTGALISTEAATAVGGSLVLDLPDLLWDAAFVAEKGSVGTTEIAQNLPIKIYPNPATSAPLHVSFDLEKPENVSFTLFDMAGRELGNLFSEKLLGGPQAIETQLPSGLPTGVYWLKVAAGSQVGAAVLEFGF